MSDTSTILTDAHFAYIAARTAGDDDYLRRLKLAATDEAIPAIWISPEQASFMQVLLRLMGAREVVEVGTLAGYSAISMARALPPGGSVRTIEIDPRHAAFAQHWADGSDVAGRVRVHLGPGTEVLAQFGDGSADAAFIDADKANYPAYLEECLRIVRPGGLVMADNAFAFGNVLDTTASDPSVRAIQAFNDLVHGEERLRGLIVPIGDGLWVSVRA